VHGGKNNWVSCPIQDSRFPHQTVIVFYLPSGCVQRVAESAVAALMSIKSPYDLLTTVQPVNRHIKLFW